MKNLSRSILLGGLLLVGLYLFYSFSKLQTFVHSSSYRPASYLHFVTFNSTGNIFKYAKTADRSSSQYYCNYPDISEGVTSQEGKGEPGWTLKQVHVVIRHGDRSPLKFDFYKSRKIRPDFCNIFKGDFADTGVLAQYKNEMTSQSSSISLGTFSGKQSSLLMNPLPQSKLCLAGHITNLGVLQQLHNGFLLRDIYVNKQQLLPGDKFDGVKVFSTRFERTFRSAAAFLYGMIPNYRIAEIPFSYANDVRFCGDDCYCPVLYNLGKDVDRRRKEMFDKQQNNVSANNILSQQHALGVLMDSLVTGFLCKGLPLPCSLSTGKCVSREDLDDIMNEQENITRVLYEDSPLLNSSMLSMQPLLHRMAKSMTKVVAKNNGAKKILLYSGHDTTVRPLLEALGVRDRRWPRLASRLIFELWEGPNRHYLKILFNGKDVTSELSFCRGTACPFSDFMEFVAHGIYTKLGVISRAQACKVNLNPFE